MILLRRKEGEKIGKPENICFIWLCERAFTMQSTLCSRYGCNDFEYYIMAVQSMVKKIDVCNISGFMLCFRLVNN